ncbi:hypothetical protein D3C75_1028700 [compost metagenome]
MPFGKVNAHFISGRKREHPVDSPHTDVHALSCILENIQQAARCGEKLMEGGIARNRLAVKNTVHIVSGGNQVATDLLVIQQSGDDMPVRALNQQFLGLQNDMDVVRGEEGQQLSILELFQSALRINCINLLPGPLPGNIRLTVLLTEGNSFSVLQRRMLMPIDTVIGSLQLCPEFK